jgi:4'-phosphopantetheinyl transferase
VQSTVQIWHLHLEPPQRRLAELRALLATDEIERAERFHKPLHRTRFTAARALLRRILADLLGVAKPHSLVFRYGEHGKPALELPPVGRSLHFSLSHSGSQGLLAAGWGRRLGIDLEARRAETEVEALAGRFFSPGEVTALAALGEPGERRAAFFRAWTRKEAYIKALGTGVFQGLDSFDVSLAPGEPAALLADRRQPEAPARWAMTALPVADGFEAALVVEAPMPTLEHWQWDWESMAGRRRSAP